MSNKPSRMDEELMGEAKLWRRMKLVVMLSGEVFEIEKVYAVTRYGVLVKIPTAPMPTYLLKHAVAQAMIDLPRKQDEESDA